MGELPDANSSQNIIFTGAFINLASPVPTSCSSTIFVIFSQLLRCCFTEKNLRLTTLRLIKFLFGSKKLNSGIGIVYSSQKHLNQSTCLMTVYRLIMSSGHLTLTIKWTIAHWAANGCISSRYLNAVGVEWKQL